MAKRSIHGGSKTDLYTIWSSIKQRCQNPKNTGYAYYGALGVVVCERWQEFALFREDVGMRPSKQHTLDRIDGFGNYEPGNVRWATRTEQQANLKCNVHLTHNGRRQNLSEWSRETGLTLGAIRHRMRKGLSVPEILGAIKTNGARRFLTFFGETKHITEWERVSGVPRKTIARRVDRGLPPETILFAGAIKRKSRQKKD
jgi:hypothetical protein